MKFERLTVPQLPLPDLVAFNQRVHERIDPWLEHPWVRRLTWAGLGFFSMRTQDTTRNSIDDSAHQAIEERTALLFVRLIVFTIAAK